MYYLVSASNNASCNFDDIDICGYQDLSDTGINWCQIHNQSETFLLFSCVIVVITSSTDMKNTMITIIAGQPAQGIACSITMTIAVFGISVRCTVNQTLAREKL